ncbi:unnamed protein product [Protopolystoma xenopodis]|uniref:Uncharacterized protein n=1 Tax=Protopolystoma xenopodis TaxID=117903 RepID=A0A448WQB3_9PLAT|nr:unnamed protein product [Protopolystoma xenopodis]
MTDENSLQGNPPTASGGTNFRIPSTRLFKRNEMYSNIILVRDSLKPSFSTCYFLSLLFLLSTSSPLLIYSGPKQEAEDKDYESESSVEDDVDSDFDEDENAPDKSNAESSADDEGEGGKSKKRTRRVVTKAYKRKCAKSPAGNPGPRGGYPGVTTDQKGVVKTINQLDNKDNLFYIKQEHL